MPFHPTCSAYAIEAIERHGAWRGFWLAARRIGRCHPWSPGGLDRFRLPDKRRAGNQVRRGLLPQPPQQA